MINPYLLNKNKDIFIKEIFKNFILIQILSWPSIYRALCGPDSTSVPKNISIGHVTPLTFPLPLRFVFLLLRAAFYLHGRPVKFCYFRMNYSPPTPRRILTACSVAQKTKRKEKSCRKKDKKNSFFFFLRFYGTSIYMIH